MSHPSSQSIIGFYQRHAYEFDELRQKYFTEKSWLDRFLNLLPSHSHILDLGCGSGSPIGEYFISHGNKIMGIDSSPPLIELCRQRFPEHQWMVEDMRALSLKERFNGILAWDSFFHLTRSDQRKMFSLFKQHAAPKAALMFTSGTSDGEAIGHFLGEELYHSSLSPHEYRTLLNENGFDVILTIQEDPDCGGRTVWLSQARN